MIIMKKRMLSITILFSIMLTVCSCSGNLKADDNADAAKNATETEDNAGVAKNGTETEDNAGGDDREVILDGVTSGEIAAKGSARDDIRNGDLTAAMIKLEQDAGYEGAYDIMLVQYLMDLENGKDVRMSDISAFMKKRAADDFIIETLSAVPAVQEYVNLYGEYTCGDVTLIISDDGSVLKRGTDEDGAEYEERKSIYYGNGKYWLDNYYVDSEPVSKEYIERSGEDLIITADGNDYTYKKKSDK